MTRAGVSPASRLPYFSANEFTDRPPVLVKSENGTYIEIFEWRSPDAGYKAQQHPEVARIWEAMAKIADLPALESLAEVKETFPHFDPVKL